MLLHPITYYCILLLQYTAAKESLRRRDCFFFRMLLLCFDGFKVWGEPFTHCQLALFVDFCWAKAYAIQCLKLILNNNTWAIQRWMAKQTKRTRRYIVAINFLFRFWFCYVLIVLQLNAIKNEEDGEGGKKNIESSTIDRYLLNYVRPRKMIYCWLFSFSLSTNHFASKICVLKVVARLICCENCIFSSFQLLFLFLSFLFFSLELSLLCRWFVLFSCKSQHPRGFTPFDPWWRWCAGD